MRTFLVHNVGPKVNENYSEAEAILQSEGLLTFDGVYRNVWEYRRVLGSRLHGAILFIMGFSVGGDNAFDAPMPLETYCDWNELHELVRDYRCEWGWHTYSHLDLTKGLSEEEIRQEITPPFPMKYFAYPYGSVNDRVAKLVEEAGYQKAFTVDRTKGDSPFWIPRSYL